MLLPICWKNDSIFDIFLKLRIEGWARQIINLLSPLIQCCRFHIIFCIHRGLTVYRNKRKWKSLRILNKLFWCDLDNLKFSDTNERIFWKEIFQYHIDTLHSSCCYFNDLVEILLLVEGFRKTSFLHTLDWRNRIWHFAFLVLDGGAPVALCKRAICIQCVKSFQPVFEWLNNLPRGVKEPEFCQFIATLLLDCSWWIQFWWLWS